MPISAVTSPTIARATRLLGSHSKQRPASAFSSPSASSVTPTTSGGRASGPGPGWACSPSSAQGACNLGRRTSGRSWCRGGVGLMEHLSELIY